ncbi:hypothetical protein AAX26_00116 [Aliarcobacter thereius]|uniref:Uncharacterized protein n=2 Tax=Aliarcobacter thereius TaxID=544718 RepID=A0A1C0BA04_9BACT|nr:hypothetical protein AAX26_00116 [Aliarcobacter thereius]OCL91926.1 hypothetical protein AAX25_00651 [Aliarcobacter thereius]OCL94976.1 hypothetical protein AA347_00422 [Aliarcobacter thereius LMG 24486]OCM00424.1 hypothetical protein AAX29_00428 [Aliarcobacter thereius]
MAILEIGLLVFLVVVVIISVVGFYMHNKEENKDKE